MPRQRDERIGGTQGEMHTKVLPDAKRLVKSCLYQAAHKLRDRVNEPSRVHLAQVGTLTIVNQIRVVERSDHGEDHRHAEQLRDQGRLPVEGVTQVEQMNYVGPEAKQLRQQSGCQPHFIHIDPVGINPIDIFVPPARDVRAFI